MTDSTGLAEKRFELLIRNILYVILLSVAPAFIFLGQAVIFIPALSIFSITFKLLWLIVSGTERESLIMVVFFVAHFIMFALVYWLLAFLLAKLIIFFRVKSTKMLLLLTTLIGIISLSQMSLYGAGGHGASKMGPIQSLSDASHTGFPAFSNLYFATVLVFLIIVGLLYWKRHSR